MRVFGCVKPLDELSELKKIHLGGKVTRLREAIVSEKCSFFNIVQTGGGQTHVQKLCRKLSCVLEVI